MFQKDLLFLPSHYVPHAVAAPTSAAPALLVLAPIFEEVLVVSLQRLRQSVVSNNKGITEKSATFLPYNVTLGQGYRDFIWMS